jgi:hypothetical protein
MDRCELNSPAAPKADLCEPVGLASVDRGGPALDYSLPIEREDAKRCREANYVLRGFLIWSSESFVKILDRNELAICKEDRRAPYHALPGPEATWDGGSAALRDREKEVEDALSRD